MGDKQTVNIARVVVGFSAVLLAGVLTISLFSPAFAQEADTSTESGAMGGGSVQGYAAASPLDYGTIVKLAEGGAGKVEVAAQSELQNMFGVAVDRSLLPITISNGDLENEAFIAVSGTYNVLVSTQAGEIASGDYVTLSSINGVAMKAGTEEPTVFGRANAPFNGKGATLGTTTLRDVNGAENETVTLGSIPVTIDIRRNPNEISTEVQVPDFLKRIGQAVAEKEVSPVRIYLSLGITVVSIIAAIALIYAGVRNGVISIGRNPMSRKSIFRALTEIILTSILILTIGLFAVYLLLRL